MTQQEEKNIIIALYPSDKNGCGFYRTFFPFRYLSCKFKNYSTTEFSAFNLDLNYMRLTNYIRFQRQVTVAQMKVIGFMKEQIQKFGFSTKICYDLDDLVHKILPSNIPAYQYYTNIRKNNLVFILKNYCDFVTFSTQYLKDFYYHNFGIQNSYVVKNFLPKHLWGLCGKRDKRGKDPNKKPRILWAGSSSHIGPGGDMDFLLPLIKKTKDEFSWVFFGVVPDDLKPFVEYHKWASVLDYPMAIDSIDADIAIAPIADNEFNLAKSDLKILEYTALNLPVVASSIGNKTGPYDLLPGLITVQNNIDDWYNAIKILTRDENVYQNALSTQKNELHKRWLENEENIAIYKNLYS